MLEILATITEKGQVTVPVEVRRKLRHRHTGEDRVRRRRRRACRVIRRPVPTVRWMIGVAGKLPRPMEWAEMREIAHEDAALAKLGANQGDASTRR